MIESFPSPRLLSITYHALRHMNHVVYSQLRYFPPFCFSLQFDSGRYESILNPKVWLPVCDVG